MVSVLTTVSVAFTSDLGLGGDLVSISRICISSAWRVTVVMACAAAFSGLDFAGVNLPAEKPAVSRQVSLAALFGLFGDGTQSSPNAGLLIGNGYSYSALDDSYCRYNNCDGGNGGVLFGNGGDGWSAIEGGRTGGNGGRAGIFGNGGNGGNSVGEGMPGGLGGYAMWFGNGGKGGNGGNGFGTDVFGGAAGGQGGNGGLIWGNGGDGGNGGSATSASNPSVTGGKGGKGGQGGLLGGSGGKGGNGGFAIAGNAGTAVAGNGGEGGAGGRLFGNGGRGGNGGDARGGLTRTPGLGGSGGSAGLAGTPGTPGVDGSASQTAVTRTAHLRTRNQR